MTQNDTASDKIKGISFASFTGIMWGIQGVFGSLLFTQYEASPEFLVSNRLFGSGILILLFCWLIRKDDMFAIFKVKGNWWRLLILGILGYVAIQYLFFITVDLAGASLGTILQFTAPAFVYIWLIVSGSKKIGVLEMSLVVLTFVGVLLLVTRGDFTSVAITPFGILTGLGSGVGLAIASIQPRKMIKDFNSSIVTGWAMFFAGALFQLYHPFWAWDGSVAIDMRAIGYTAFVVFFGTTLAFLSYSAASNYIDSSLASILTVFEPLVATLLSVIIFGQTFNMYEIVGIVLILGSIIALSLYPDQTAAEETSLAAEYDHNEVK